jgi:hypothetical protein
MSLNLIRGAPEHPPKPETDARDRDGPPAQGQGVLHEADEV